MLAFIGPKSTSFFEYVVDIVFDGGPGYILEAFKQSNFIWNFA